MHTARKRNRKSKLLIYLFILTMVFTAAVPCLLPPALLEAEESSEEAPTQLGDETSMLLGDEKSRYELPLTEGFTYNDLNLHSIYVLVRQISPLGTVDMLKSNVSNRAQMGALTQLMTYYVLQEYFHEVKLDDMNTEVEIKEDELVKTTELGGILSGLVPGDKLTINDLLHAMLLSGGADAAYTLLRLIGTSEKAFVQRMNLTAEKLGMKDTHYADLVGIEEKNAYTSLNDTAILLEKLLQDKLFTSIITTREHYTAPTAAYENGMYFSALIESYAADRQIDISFLDGGKTGHSSSGGYCLAGFRKVGSTTYLILTAKAKEAGEDLQDQMNIMKKMQEIPFDWPLLGKGAVLASVPLSRDGKIDESLGHQLLKSKDGYRQTLPLLADIGSYELRSDVPESFDYPLSPGAEAGKIDIVKDDEKGPETVHREKLFLPENREALAGAMATPVPQKDEKDGKGGKGGTETSLSETEQNTAAAGQSAKKAETKKDKKAAGKDKEGGFSAKILLIPLIVIVLLLLIIFIYWRRLEAKRKRLNRLRRLQRSYPYGESSRDDVSTLLKESKRKQQHYKEQRRPQREERGQSRPYEERERRPEQRGQSSPYEPRERRPEYRGQSSPYEPRERRPEYRGQSPSYEQRGQRPEERRQSRPYDQRGQRGDYRQWPPRR